MPVLIVAAVPPPPGGAGSLLSHVERIYPAEQAVRDSPEVFDLVVRPARQAFRDLRPAVSDLGPCFGHGSLLGFGPCALLNTGVCFQV